MQLRKVINKEALREKERELDKWIREEAGPDGIRLEAQEVFARRWEKANTKERQAIRKEEQESLWLVSTAEEEDLAKEAGIAILPCNFYVRDCWMTLEGLDDLDSDLLRRAFQREKGLPWTIVERPHFILRELALSDLDALFALYEQPGMTDYMEGLYDRAEEEEYQRAYIANMYRFYGYGMWLVIDPATGALIGRAGLEHRELSRKDGENEWILEMGYMIAPSHQGKGLATEICRFLIDYARENLEFEEINCLVREDNRISLHMMEKLGFRKVCKEEVNQAIFLRFTRPL